MKLCQNYNLTRKGVIKSLCFGRLLSVLAMLLVGVFFINTSAKAATTAYYNINDSNTTCTAGVCDTDTDITITETSTIFCALRGSMTSMTSRPNVYLGTSTSTPFTRLASNWGGTEETYSFYYMRNVAAGTYNIKTFLESSNVDVADFGRSDMVCTINDQDLEFNAVYPTTFDDWGTGSTSNFILTGATSGQYAIAALEFPPAGGLFPTSTSLEPATDIVALYYGPHSAALLDGVFTSDNPTETVDKNGNTWVKINYFVFDIIPPETSNDYILYYGDNPAYTDISSSYDLPLVYNICDSWDSEEIYVLGLYSDTEVSLASDVIELSSCSGTISFDKLPLSLSSNTAHFKISQVFASDIVSSNEFLSVIWGTPDPTNNYIIPVYPNPYYVDTTNSTSTPFEFAFDICDLSNWSDYRFALFDEHEQAIYASTYYQPSSCTDIGTISLEYTQKLNKSFYLSIGLFPDSSTVLQRKSDSLLIVFNSDILDKDRVNIFGASSYDLACTTEEWAESEAWLNTFPSSCSIKKGFWDIVIGLASAVQSLVDYSGQQLVNTFPLNIPNQILKSWNSSAHTALSSDLEILNSSDSNGDISGYIPKEWLGTSTDATPIIFGKTVMTANNNSNAVTMWANVRKLTTWLQWFLFVLGFVLWSKSVYKDLSSETHNDKNL